MQTIKKPELNNLGYIWGPKSMTSECSWLQFADDAVIVSNSVANAQLLLNIFVTWCKWSDLIIRLDKCSSFGMMKANNIFGQIEPHVFINSQMIPPIPMGG